MEKETIQLCAYHEAARVVFAYQCGYICHGIELSAVDAGAGTSKLHGQQDMELVQALIAKQAISANNETRAIEVAKNLMKIYCAGTCAAVYYEQDMVIDSDTEIEIPHQDVRYIQVIQNFLQQHIPHHSPDYPSHIMAGIIAELRNADIWRAIDGLAKVAIENAPKALNRFQIEDTLMVARFDIKRQPTGSGNAGIGLSDSDADSGETDEERKKRNSFNDEPVIDILLKDFLVKIKKDLTDDELKLSIVYLKGLFKKYPA